MGQIHSRGSCAVKSSLAGWEIVVLLSLSLALRGSYQHPAPLPQPHATREGGETSPQLGRRAHSTLPEVVKLCMKTSIQTPIFMAPGTAMFGADTSPSSQQLLLLWESHLLAVWTIILLSSSSSSSFFFPEGFFSRSCAVTLTVPHSTGWCGAIHHS